MNNQLLLNVYQQVNRVPIIYTESNPTKLINSTQKTTIYPDCGHLAENSGLNLEQLPEK
jgi:hypothetical protein